MLVCRDCMYAIRSRGLGIGSRSAQQWTRRSFITSSIPQKHEKRQAPSQHRPRIQRDILSRSIRRSSTQPTRKEINEPTDLEAIHARIAELSSSALSPDDGQLPSEQRLLYVFEHLDALATSLIDPASVASAKQQRAHPHATNTTATSALLGSVHARPPASTITKPALLNLLARRAEEILRSPTTFITPALLDAYVNLQSRLHQPASFPDIFDLYATKPTPTQTPTGITYTPASLNAAKAAVDPDTANTALKAATESHNLPLSLDIISTTFCTPAHKRAKLLRRALLPSALLAATPLAAWTISTQLSHLQTTMSQGYATGVAFAGLMTYTSVVGALGYIVITTANDQMERVTWAKGVPLWERWIREEERAAVDLVAGTWGFADVERRGEEEGVEWESLREWVGLRGMVFDKPELMEGME